MYGGSFELRKSLVCLPAPMQMPNANSVFCSDEPRSITWSLVSASPDADATPSTYSTPSKLCILALGSSHSMRARNAPNCAALVSAAVSGSALTVLRFDSLVRGKRRMRK